MAMTTRVLMSLKSSSLRLKAFAWASPASAPRASPDSKMASPGSRRASARSASPAPKKNIARRRARISGHLPSGQPVRDFRGQRLDPPAQLDPGSAGLGGDEGARLFHLPRGLDADRLVLPAPPLLHLFL